MAPPHHAPRWCDGKRMGGGGGGGGGGVGREGGGQRKPHFPPFPSLNIRSSKCSCGSVQFQLLPSPKQWGHKAFIWEKEMYVVGGSDPVLSHSAVWRFNFQVCFVFCFGLFSFVLFLFVSFLRAWCVSDDVFALCIAGKSLFVSFLSAAQDCLWHYDGEADHWTPRSFFSIIECGYCSFCCCCCCCCCVRK